MNPYLLFILTVLLLRLGIESLADFLNLRRLTLPPPETVRDVYDPERYRRAQDYLRVNTRFGLFEDFVHTAVLIAFLLLGGFGALDHWARHFQLGLITTGLLFVGALMLLDRLLRLPFEIVDTFVIEQRFGFNRTNARTFVLDHLKGLLLLALLGGPLLALVLWLFGREGPGAWMYVWAAVTAFQILIVFLGPMVIMPLFNKFTPLPDGELKRTIETYARDQHFALGGMYVMDGSRRSAKSNAFFTGFGHARRIVFFDTLIAAHTVPELLGVLAHEMGHYKRHHILKAILRSVALTGLSLLLMSRFLNNPGLTAAFGVATPSTYTSLVCFGFLYAPVALLIGLIEHAISRRHEYEADDYAARTTGTAQPLIDALKKLGRHNLSNLTPHPFKVFTSYSHPPLPDRIEALRRSVSSSSSSSSSNSTDRGRGRRRGRSDPEP